MNQQKKKILRIVTVLILAIVLIAALIIGNKSKDKKPTNNNGLSTEINSENEVVDSTETVTEDIQETEKEEMIETDNSTETEGETTEEDDAEIAVPSTSETIEPEQSKPKWTVTDLNKTMYAKSWVNVRKGPGTEYDKLGSLTSNQEVLVTGKCNECNWYRINYNGNEGYVSSDYLVNEKVVNNTDNENNNSESVEESKPEDTKEDEIVKVPTTPEPEWGTFKYEDPNDGWNYMPVYVWDHWNYSGNDGWTREVRQTTMWNKEQDYDDIFDIVNIAYPWRTDIGTEGQTIEYPTLWVYFGDGPEEW